VIHKTNEWTKRLVATGRIPPQAQILYWLCSLLYKHISTATCA